MEDLDKSEDTNAVKSSAESTSETVKESETQQEEPECLESKSQPKTSEQDSSTVCFDTAVNNAEIIDNGDDGEEDDDQIEVDAAAIDKLTNGVLELFLPNLQKAKGSLNELLHNQEVLIETVQQENSKFTDSASMKELVDMMQEAKRYHTKLVTLKREMNALTEKSAKLKRGAVKIQQQKQKEELTRADQIERERERERMLTAKVAKPRIDQKE